MKHTSAWAFVRVLTHTLGVVIFCTWCLIAPSVFAFIFLALNSFMVGYWIRQFFIRQAREDRLGRVLAHEDLKSIYNKKEGKR